MSRHMAISIESTTSLPGDVIPSDRLPPSKKGTLILGPGVRHVQPSEIIATNAGSLKTDTRKAAVWIEHDAGRYVPTVGDLVVAQVHHSATDLFYCSIAAYSSNATLGHLSFEGASRKTRPQLKSGDLVYARVSRAVKGEDVELECVSPSTGKSEGLGQLKGGMIFNVSTSFARRLMMAGSAGGVTILEALGEKLNFEIAVGRNGLVWIQAATTATTLVIGNLLLETESKAYSQIEQGKTVKRALKQLGLAG